MGPASSMPSLESPSEITTPWIAHKWAHSAGLQALLSPQISEGLYRSSFSWPPKLPLAFSPRTVSLVQIFLPPQKSHYKKPKTLWINAAVIIGLTVHSKQMCDDFLTIKMVVFLIQNSDIFVQKQLFLFKLKNYEDRKLQLGGGEDCGEPSLKIYAIVWLPLSLISKTSITALTEQPEVQIIFSFISEVLKRLNALQIGWYCMICPIHNHTETGAQLPINCASTHFKQALDTGWDVLIIFYCILTHFCSY